MDVKIAIRTFDPGHQMSSSEQRALFELAMLAPSAWNIQHWCFVLIDEPTLRQQLQSAAANQAQVCDAAMLVVIVVDLMAWQDNPARYFDTSPAEVADVLGAKVLDFYADNPTLARDDAMRSCGLAAQTLMLAATVMGLATGPMDMFDEQKVAHLLNLPQNHVPAMFVAIGHAREENGLPRAGRLAYDEIVINNRFSAQSPYPTP
ncbi:MAG: nitroreductase family protein [Magnetovibrio sp.]|nr:nitroreductase family protein [Magnetovibrio sp.]